MSVDPFVILAKHYGSAYTMSDFKSRVHYAYLTTSVTPTPKFRATGTVGYTISKSSLDQVIMPDVSSRLGGDLAHQDFTFAEMNAYSDLDYRMLRLSVGGALQLARSVTLTADVDFADLSDKARYVYGSETGTMTIIRTGLRYDF